MVGFIAEHPECDDVLEHVLVLLGQAEVLSRKGVRACCMSGASWPIDWA